MPLPKGFVFTKESREKMSRSGKGRIFTAEHRANMSKAMKGIKKSPFTQEHLMKLAEARRKRPLKEKILKIKLPTVYRKRPEMTGENNPASRPEVRKKIAESKMGNKNPNWRGGTSPMNALIRASSEYRLFREAVFKRDNFICQDCGARNGNGKAVVLNVDHIKPFALFPELRFAIDNGITLCIDCHKKTSTYGFKISDYKLNEKI